MNSLFHSLNASNSIFSWVVNVWKFEANADDSVWWNNGTVTWATLTTWKSWNAYSFNGTNNYITISTLSSSIKGISFWAKKSSTWAYWRVMWATWGTYYLMQLYNDGNNYSRILSGQTLSFAQTDDTNWHNYIITADWTTAKIYVDWVLKLSQASTGNFANMNQIARYTTTNNSANLWRWLIDEIVTWNRVLTDWGVSVGSTASWEVATIYNAWAWFFY